MKLNKNILLGIIVVILCSLFVYYWFFINKVKEGLTTTKKQVTLTSSSSIPMKITSLVITGGWDYLHLSEITIKDSNNQIIPYSSTNSSAGGNKGYVSNIKGLGWSGTLDGLKDGDINTYFHSGSRGETLTISLFEPTYISSVLIRNMTPLQRIASGYTLKLFASDITIISHRLDEPQLRSGEIIRTSYPGTTQGTADYNTDKENTNVVVYNIVQPPAVTGAPGAIGPTGPRGLTGFTGPTGSTGPTGPRGLSGPSGIDGVDGPTGPRGVDGVAGIAGLTGPTGPRGDNGMNGQTFYNSSGSSDSSGSSGSSGPSGLSRANEYSYFGTSSIQTIENFSIMESLSEPMACLSSPASYI
jgi:hypothetical protein